MQQKQLQFAWSLLQGGDTRQGMAVFMSLADQPGCQASACAGLAQAHLMQGQAQQALSWAEKAVAWPGVPVQGHLLYARALRMTGQAARAVAHCEGVLRQLPTSVELMTSLALAQREAGQADAAEQTYLAALKLAPGELALHQNLANLRQARGALDEAEAGYRQVLQRQPGHPMALYELGQVARQRGRPDEARACFEAAVRAQARLAPAWRALAQLDEQAGHIERACQHLVEAIQADPQDARNWFELGRLRMQDDPQAAMSALEEGLQRAPTDKQVWSRLCQLAFASGAFLRGWQAASQWATGQAQEPQAHYFKALFGRALGRADESLAAASQALVLAPAENLALECLYLQTTAQLDIGDLAAAQAGASQLGAQARGAVQQATAHEIQAAIDILAGHIAQGVAHYEASIALLPERFAPRAAACAAALYRSDMADDAVLAQVRRLMAPFNPYRQAAYFANERRPDKVLRIGYVSGDLRQHSCAYFLAPLLAAHDPAAVFTVAYSTCAQQDATTERLRQHMGLWRDVAHLDARSLRQQIRDDGIDILIDLSGFTDGGRLQALASRAAPVQCTWLGYLGSSGLDAIDYRITDECANPPVHDGLMTEQAWRLPRPYVCYEADAAAPAPSPLPMLDKGHVTFGSFNVLQKVSPACVALWAGVLRRVPDARLVLKTRALSNAAVRDELLAAFAAHGISPERLELLSWIEGQAHHLDLYGRIDVALDTFPYNGVTTTCEALWMGVPVVSRHGHTAVSRQGLALLRAVGLEALAVPDDEAFAHACAQLVADAPALAALRQSLRARMQASALMDGSGFARDMEAAYRAMWRRWCAGRSTL